MQTLFGMSWRAAAAFRPLFVTERLRAHPDISAFILLHLVLIFLGERGRQP
jgi:hypothetical protein